MGGLALMLAVSCAGSASVPPSPSVAVGTLRPVPPFTPPTTPATTFGAAPAAPPATSTPLTVTPPRTPAATPPPTAPPPTAPPPTAPPLSPDLVFVADPGIRVAGGVPTAVLDGGTTYLYFNGNARLATSADGLAFGEPRQLDRFRERRLALRLADGTYRLYVPAGLNCCGLKSFSSTDGVTFREDPGLRYSLDPSDNGTFGFQDVWVDASGGVVLLYVGDMRGANNVRRAYAKDGMTFVFEDGNVLGDAQAGGGDRTFVDQRSIPLPDGRRRLLVMQAFTIYSFITSDGRTFVREPGERLRPNEFKDVPVRSLHDPTVVRLPDGRYRMYVGAFDTSGREMILSATSR